MNLFGKRIFLVEDDRGNIAVVKTILEHEQAVIQFDRWGHDTAARVLAFLPVDLILLDLMLANGLSGFEVYHQLRAIPELATTPIVAFTAADPTAMIPKAQQAGFSGYIAKPVRIDTFSKYINSILEGQPQWIAGG